MSLEGFFTETAVIYCHVLCHASLSVPSKMSRVLSALEKPLRGDDKAGWTDWDWKSRLRRLPHDTQLSPKEPGMRTLHFERRHRTLVLRAPVHLRAAGAKS